MVRLLCLRAKIVPILYTGVLVSNNPQKNQRKHPDYSKAPSNTRKRMGHYVPNRISQLKADPTIHSLRVFEKYLEKILIWLKSLALLEILGIVGNIGIVVGLLSYVGSEKQRRDAEVFNAWQTITSAYGQAGSGGRIQALEFLNASPGANWRRKFPWFCTPLPLCTWPAENLDGIDISVKAENSTSVDNQLGESILGAYLSKVQLPNARLIAANMKGANLEWSNLKDVNLEAANLIQANLRGANLESSNLESVNLEGANLEKVNLSFANLNRANLTGAYLSEANLRGTEFSETNLTGSDFSNAILSGANLKTAKFESTKLEGANMQGVDLRDAELQDVDFWKVNLSGARLHDADLREANLRETNLTSTILWGADLSGAILQDADLSSTEFDPYTYVDEEQLEKAMLCRTKLPNHISLNPNRDCDTLSTDSLKERVSEPAEASRLNSAGQSPTLLIQLASRNVEIVSKTNVFSVVHKYYYGALKSHSKILYANMRRDEDQKFSPLSPSSQLKISSNPFHSKVV